MRRFLNFVIGETVLIDSRECVFKGFKPSGVGRIEEEDDFLFVDSLVERPIVMPLAQFNELNNTGRIKRVNAHEKPGESAPEADAPDMEKRRARKYVLEQFDASGFRKSESSIRIFLKNLSGRFPYDKKYLPSPGHLIRLLRERGRQGDRRLRHMGDRYRSSGLRMHPIVQKIMAEVAEREYWNGSKKKPLDIWALVFRAVQKESATFAEQGLSPLKPPSKATVWRYLKAHQNAERTTKRHGKKISEATWEPIKGSMKAERILDTAVFDHTTIDCWVIDDETGIPVGRPHLGVLIDVCSRYPLGFYIGFEEPSLHSVMATIKCGIKSKEWINRLYPSINGTWIAYGSPRTIVVDNAWESVGSSFVDACEDARINVQWAPVHRPQYKAIVERHFGTLNTKLWRKLPGAVPHKPHILKEYGIDPEKDSVLCLSQLRAAYCQMIIEVYGREPTRALGKSPEQIWREREPIDLIESPPDIAALEAAFGRVVDATLSREGIVIDGIPYHSPDVTRDLLRDLLPHEPVRGRSRGTVKVKVKVHPDDLCVLHVLNHERNVYVPMPCAHPRYVAGISEHHHKAVKEFARRKNLEFNSEEQQAEARARLHDLVASITPIKIKHRRQAQRLKEQVQPDGGLISTILGDPQPASLRSSHEVMIDAISDRADGRDRFKSPVRAKKKKRIGPQPANTEDSSTPKSQGDEPTVNTIPVSTDVIDLIAAARQRRKEKYNA